MGGPERGPVVQQHGATGDGGGDTPVGAAAVAAAWSAAVRDVLTETALPVYGGGDQPAAAAAAAAAPGAHAADEHHMGRCHIRV